VLFQHANQMIQLVWSESCVLTLVQENEHINDFQSGVWEPSGNGQAD